MGGSRDRGMQETMWTVEDCLVLDVNKLARDGMIGAGERRGSLNWRNVRTGEQTASVGYECTGTGDRATIVLAYTVSRHGERKQDVSMRIGLQTTKPQFGGRRWWFECPLVVGDRRCHRRVGKLYLPPGGLYFGCRQCHSLTYTSCQDSHKYDRLFASLASGVGCPVEDVKERLRPER